MNLFRLQSCNTTNPTYFASLLLLLLLLLLLVLLLPLHASALEVDSHWHVLNAEFEYLEDPENEISLDDLLHRPQDFKFQSSAKSKPVSVFQPIWLKLELNFNQETRAERYKLVARVGNLVDLRIYRESSDGGFTEHITGNRYPANTRELDTPRYAFTVPTNRDSTTIYIRMVGGAASTNLAWDLAEESFYNAGEHTYYVLTASCFAAIGALLIFNFLIALSLWRLDYFYYCGCVFFILLSLITQEGEGFTVLWPQWPALNDRALHTFVLASAIFQLLTVNTFLNTAQVSHFLARLSRLAIGLMITGIAGVWVFGVSALPPLAPTMLWAFGSATIYLVCTHAVFSKQPLALPLLVCILIPKLATILQALLTVHSQNLGIAEMQLAKVGVVFHVLLFSLCLGAHLRQEMASHRQALHDALTGLPSKRLLQEHFEWMKSVAKRQGQALSVLFIDLDGFKAVNDSLGHDAGDELLRQAACRMRLQLRETDVLSRLGGDEFVVVLASDTGINPTNIVSARLKRALREPFELGDKRASISASIGAATAAAEISELDALLRSADAAMYREKRCGKVDSLQMTPPVPA